MTGKELTDEELQEIADTYGLYTEQDVENRVSCELLRIGARNEDLEKENAELKKQQFSLRNERNTFLAQNEQYEKDLIDFNDNLTKAKDIIRNLLRVTYGEGWNYSLDWKVKAEQFLKENK